MQYVADRTSIPVPKVLSYTSSRDGTSGTVAVALIEKVLLKSNSRFNEEFHLTP